MKVNRDFCISSYLTFRYVVRPGVAWQSGVLPEFPDPAEQGTLKVRNAAEILAGLREAIEQSCTRRRVGLLLSAGMDSALVGALLPKGTPAYTVQFAAEDAIDEAPAARLVAKSLGLEHHVVRVTWQDYGESVDSLMVRKKSPLHAAEIGLYRAAQAAKKDGVEILVVGNGADSTFGGMDKLLAKNWTFDQFVERYTFLDPVKAVKRPLGMLDVYEPFRSDDGFDVMGFLKTIHGRGIIQMFENAIHAGGCSLIAPFEKLSLDAPLDIARIRNGEPKYLLNEVFREVCPNLEIPRKIPFARPVTQWLQNWTGPQRPEFLEDLAMNSFNGEQKWQIYCLERFLDLMSSGRL